MGILISREDAYSGASWAASTFYSGVASIRSGVSFTATILSTVTPQPIQDLAQKSYEVALPYFQDAVGYVAETKIGKIVTEGYQAASKALELKKQVLENPTEFLSKKIKGALEKVSLKEILEKPPSDLKLTFLDKIANEFINRQTIPFKGALKKKISAHFQAKKGIKTPISDQQLQKIQTYLSGLLTPKNTKNATVVALDVLNKILVTIQKIEAENTFNGKTDKEAVRKQLLKKLLGNDTTFKEYQKTARKEINVAVSKIAGAAILDKKSKHIVARLLNKILAFFAKFASRLFVLDAVDSLYNTGRTMANEQINKGLPTNIPLKKIMGIDIVSLNLSPEDVQTLLARFDIYGEIIFTYAVHQLSTGIANVIEKPDQIFNPNMNADAFIPNAEGIQLNEKIDKKWNELTTNLQPVLAKTVNAATDHLSFGASATAKGVAWMTGLNDEKNPLPILKEIKLSELMDSIQSSFYDAINK